MVYIVANEKEYEPDGKRFRHSPAGTHLMVRPQNYLSRDKKLCFHLDERMIQCDDADWTE